MPDSTIQSTHINSNTRESNTAAGSSISDSSASVKDVGRHSPFVPLAPLEYLQTQRRGSITDPSLHAAAQHTHMSGASKTNHTHLSMFRQSELPPLGVPSTSRDGHGKLPEPRPASPYVFGDATPLPSESNTIRRILRTPSPEREEDNAAREGLKSTHGAVPRPATSGSLYGGHERHHLLNGTEKMDVDSYHQPTSAFHHHTMRRHSIASAQGHHVDASPLGTKRKIASDFSKFPALGEGIDPKMIGSTIHKSFDADPPPAKQRRGSAVDTQKIAQLSLYDQRRNSVDSRGIGGAGGGHWWLSDGRRGTSTTTTLLPALGGGYASAFAAESVHGRSPSGATTFAWPSSAQPSEQSIMQSEAAQNLQQNTQRPPFDSGVPPMSMMPPMSFPSDRRMVSVQDNATATSGPTAPHTRVLRSRSRPPSRQLRRADSPGANQPPLSASSSAGQDDMAVIPSSPGPAKSKEPGPTPYSRSPELRVSHKLAERKRRKEMKELFDELREQLPNDRGMKASKWEILSKAIDFVATLKQRDQEMAREIEALRHELDTVRQASGLPPYGASGQPHAVLYVQAPSGPGSYPSPTTGAVTQPGHSPLSRPPSSQNIYPPGAGPPTTQNGNPNRVEAPPP